MKKEKTKKQKQAPKSLINGEKGITLIALVVTIVVLLILAGITITFVLGEGGILDMAKEAAKRTNEAKEQELKDFADFQNQVENWINGGTSSSGDSTSGDVTPPADPSPTPETLKEAIEQNYKFAQNTPLKDEFGNPVTIPAGFHIVMKKDDPTVDYNYSKTNPGTPTVQDGIVVADKAGNQFVWIPIETDDNLIKNREDDNHADDTKIKLGRYSFDVIYNSGSDPTGSGEATLVQSADQYDKDASQDGYKDYRIYKNNDNVNNSWYFYEYMTGKGNTVTKNLKDFIESATENRGYYLARFEAGQDSGKVVSKSGTVYNNANQRTASEKSIAMYENDNYTSDLTNSYAWDTAIVFIQKYSDNKKYSMLTSRNDGSSPSNTGERKRRH